MLQAISPFSTMFSKDLSCRQVQTRPCLGKGTQIKQTRKKNIIISFTNQSCNNIYISTRH